MKKLAIIALAFVSLSGVVTAQNITDIVYINSPINLGTPRYTATGGAFTSLGNDFTAVHLNPAGLAVFRHDEFGISFGVASRTVSSNYYNTNQSQDWTNFLFANVGYTKKILTDDPNVTWNFGISYNRNSDFSSESETFGLNPESTVIEDWMFFADGTPPEDLFDNGLIFEQLAWDALLIEADANNIYYTEAVLGTTEQFWSEKITGRFDELGFSLATERNNKLYLGGSLNIPFYRYDSEFYYTEAYQTGGDSINSMEWWETFSNRGVGLNVKFGAIYKPIENLRVGASIFSPTILWINQTYSTDVQGNFMNGQSVKARFESDRYDYTLRNAPVGNIGASYIFNKNGFISVDYSFIPTKWSGTATNELNYLKSDIDNFLNNQHFVRIGAEVRLVSIYLRGGYSWQSNPYNFSSTTPIGLVEQDATRNTFSFGIGYRTNRFTIDAAYSIQNEDQNAFPYSSEIVQAANQTITRRPFIVSASFRL
jgi:hypothetical protein